MKQNESFPNGLPYHLWYDEIFYPNWNKHAVEPSKEVLQFRYNEYLQRIERNNYQRLLDSNKELLAIVKQVAHIFGNEANYPEGTVGYNLCKRADKLINPQPTINSHE
jgi:hypothetical protein